jgi:hypothetical protein
MSSIIPANPKRMGILLFLFGDIMFIMLNEFFKSCFVISDSRDNELEDGCIEG